MGGAFCVLRRGTGVLQFHVSLKQEVASSNKGLGVGSHSLLLLLFMLRVTGGWLDLGRAELDRRAKATQITIAYITIYESISQQEASQHFRQSRSHGAQLAHSSATPGNGRGGI